MSKFQKKSRNLVLLISILLLVLYLGIYVEISYLQSKNIWMIQALGYTAVGALFLSLLMSPLIKSGKYISSLQSAKAYLVQLRRHLGIASACFALIHAIWVYLTYLNFNWQVVLELTYLKSGLLALIIFTLLLITSFPKLIKKFKLKYWKELHRLVYVLPVLLFQHLFLSPFADRAIASLIILSFLVLFTSRLLLPGAKRQI